MVNLKFIKMQRILKIMCFNFKDRKPLPGRKLFSSQPPKGPWGARR